MKRPSRGILFLWTAAAMLLLTGAALAGAADIAQDEASAFALSGVGTTSPLQISEIGRNLNTPLADRPRSLLGLFVLGFIAWLLSNDRKAIPWRVVAWGAALQLLFAVFILKTPVRGLVFDGLNTAVMALPGFTLDGASFIFGMRTALNEFYAYRQLATTLGQGTDLQPRSIIIATYALSGFANFASIAVQIGGIGGIAPSRRDDIARMGLRAMIGGTISAFMTATVAGMLL